MQPFKFINKTRAIIFIFIAVASFIHVDTTRAFSVQISKTTSAEPYPHILKTQTFDLNTRNIKVLTSQGKHLWIGTGQGIIRYDTHTNEDYKVYTIKTICSAMGFSQLVWTLKTDLGSEPTVADSAILTANNGTITIPRKG